MTRRGIAPGVDGKWPSARTRRALRVLVVEDDPALRPLMRDSLSEEGHAVETARDGVEALDLVERSPPDLIVLDLNLPVLSGGEFLRRYRGRAVIIVVTGVADAERSLGQLRVDAIVRKPFDLVELLALLQRQVAVATQALGS